jgi:hypothetical protein
MSNFQKVQAVSSVNWNAGRIIDDSTFIDKNALSVSQIQSFLNTKVGTGGYGKTAGQCDTSGSTITPDSGGITRAQYGASKGNPAPFTCLKDYYEVPKTTPGPGIPPSNYGGVAIPAGAKSSAQIIWEASQQYNISPKVLLVLIQKESAGPLITDDWPFKRQYTYAMGAHCPDSGPNGTANCDENYAGFSMQVYESARLFRYYLNNMGQPWWPYKKPGLNNILWNVSTSGCGSSPVNIQTQATAALYTYTPYQPNQAALNNMYGSGDACSAYGNRNFWRMYHDWFGTTFGNCVFPISTGVEIFRTFNPNTNSYFLSKDPYEVCELTSKYGYIYDDVAITTNNTGDPIFRLEQRGNYVFTSSAAERDSAVQNFGYRYEGVAFYGGANANSDNPFPVYRLVYPLTGAYAYTISAAERDLLINTMGYRSEGISFYTNNSIGQSLNDVFRLGYGYQLYTISSVERDSAVQNYGYRFEGVGFRTRPGFTVDNLPVYRLAGNNGYLFTTSIGERKRAIQLGFRAEGTGYYGYNTTNLEASKAVYRLSHPGGNYFYTISDAERTSAVQNYGYRFEGVGFRIP